MSGMNIILTQSDMYFDTITWDLHLLLFWIRHIASNPVWILTVPSQYHAGSFKQVWSRLKYCQRVKSEIMEVITEISHWWNGFHLKSWGFTGIVQNKHHIGICIDASVIPPGKKTIAFIRQQFSSAVSGTFLNRTRTFRLSVRLSPHETIYRNIYRYINCNLVLSMNFFAGLQYLSRFHQLFFCFRNVLPTDSRYCLILSTPFIRK